MDDTDPSERTTHLEQQHPLVAAAQAGFGPLSAKATAMWHGESTPCVSCARLNARAAAVCVHCGQDLSQDMLQRMSKHSGPWFVYDNLRPFPGVSLERIARQIKRGVLNRTAIVRGPTTFYQWRYATETPLVAKLLGHCWNCQRAIPDEDERYCPQCKVVLDGHYRPEQLDGGVADSDRVLGAGSAADSLRELHLALHNVHRDGNPAPPIRRERESLAGVAVIAVVVALVLVVGIALVLSTMRGAQGGSAAPASTGSQTDSLQLPAPPASSAGVKDRPYRNPYVTGELPTTASAGAAELNLASSAVTDLDPREQSPAGYPGPHRQAILTKLARAGAGPFNRIGDCPASPLGSLHAPRSAGCTRKPSFSKPFLIPSGHSTVWLLLAHDDSMQAQPTRLSSIGAVSFAVLGKEARWS